MTVGEGFLEVLRWEWGLCTMLGRGAVSGLLSTDRSNHATLNYQRLGLAATAGSCLRSSPCSLQKHSYPISIRVLLESSIIPCLPWPQVWDNMIQDKPLKFLPQRLWYGAGGGPLPLGHRPWKDMKTNCWCRLTWLGKGLSVSGEKEIITQR